MQNPGPMLLLLFALNQVLPDFNYDGGDSVAVNRAWNDESSRVKPVGLVVPDDQAGDFAE